MSTIWAFDAIESNHNVCRGKVCMKINFEKKKITP